MKKIALLTALLAVTTVVSAQEQGRVLSATPVVQQVGIPQQVCGNETVYNGSHNSGAGALLGAIAGGAAGNAVGLAQLQRGVLVFDDAGADVGKRRQLRGQRQPRRAAADDEHVHLGRYGIGVRQCMLRRVVDQGIAGLEAVQVELHGMSLEGGL